MTRLHILSSLLVVLVGIIQVDCATTTKEESLPPSFFLQDTGDSLCLAGETFKRCSIDTLFYVVGAPGAYRINKRATDGKVSTDEDDDGICLAKQSCLDTDATKIMPAVLAKCSHCGAKSWNILGDSDTGYVLTEGSDDGTATKLCIFRQGMKVVTAPCDTTEVPYSPLQLRFASASDIRTMSSPGARMISASADGNLELIKTMLTEEKIDINVRDWDDLTALIPAASSGHMNVVQYLVENGIDVNAADKDGITALMDTAIMGHADIVKYLIEKGANVDAEATSEVTALWLASSEGKVDCMKILLEAGASASNTRSDGISALMTASIGGHADALKLLIANGADVTVSDREGSTPLMNAAENGTVPVLQIFVEATQKDPTYLNQASKAGFTALVIASAHGHAPAVEYLLSVGASKDVSATENQVTPLMFAAASNHVSVVEVLLKANVDINAKHSNGGTALIEAATGGSVDAMKLLLDAGADFTAADDDGVTPLMAIASQGKTDGVQLVLDALKGKFNNDASKLKDYVNLISKSGGSTLMFSTAGGHVETTRMLMNAGGDINVIARSTPDYVEKIIRMKAEGTSNEIDDHVDGVTALHVAALGGHLDAVNLLIENNVDVSILDDNKRSPLSLAIKGNYGKVAMALVNAGADPNTSYVDDDGVTHNLLMDSIMVENKNFTEILLAKGASIYYQDNKKVSILLQASHRGFTDIVKSILEIHKSTPKDKQTIDDFINAPSDEGIAPLTAASSEGHPDVVKLLIQYGANLNVVDQDQTTALMAASARGHSKVVTALVEAGALINNQNVDGHTALMFAYNAKNQVETLWERYVTYVNDATIKASASSTGDDSGGKAAAKIDTEDDSGTGPIIRNALDDHLALVDVLLKAGADTTVKDKEGHTAKDFDFNPDIDSDSIKKSIKNEKLKDESKYEL